MKIIVKFIFIFIVFALSLLQVKTLGQELKNIELKMESLPKIAGIEKKNYQDLAPNLVLQVPLMMEINGKHSRQGVGTIVSGRILQGQVSVPNEVSLLGNRSTLTTVVTQVSTNKKIVESVKAGDDVGLVLRGIRENQIKKGMILISPGSIQMHKAFRAEVKIPEDLILENPGPHNKFDIKAKSGFLQLRIHGADITAEYFLPTKNYWGACKIKDSHNIITKILPLISSSIPNPSQ